MQCWQVKQDESQRDTAWLVLSVRIKLSIPIYTIKCLPLHFNTETHQRHCLRTVEQTAYAEDGGRCVQLSCAPLAAPPCRDESMQVTSWREVCSVAAADCVSLTVSLTVRGLWCLVRVQGVPAAPDVAAGTRIASGLRDSWCRSLTASSQQHPPVLSPASPAVRMLVPDGSGFATDAAATGAWALRSRRSASSWACASQLRVATETAGESRKMVGHSRQRFASGTAKCRSIKW